MGARATLVIATVLGSLAIPVASGVVEPATAAPRASHCAGSLQLLEARPDPSAVVLRRRGCTAATGRVFDTAPYSMPITGDFDGDGKSDVLAYSPGPHADRLWYGAAGGFSAGPPVTINGDYLPAVGDFNGDGHYDILWYDPMHPSASSMWLGASRGMGFTHGAAIAPPTGTDSDIYLAVPADFDGDGKSDIAWVDFGFGDSGAHNAGVVWYGARDGFVMGPSFDSPPCITPDENAAICAVSIQDFNGDGHADLLQYRSGSGADTLSYSSGRHLRAGPAITVDGFYLPGFADFNGDGHGDVLWFGPGPSSDYLWYGRTSGFRAGPSPTINGSYFFPITGDFNGDGKADVVWYARGSHPDYLWYGTRSGFRQGPRIAVNDTFFPMVGDFNGDGKQDILWFSQSGRPSHIWYGAASSFRNGTPIAL